jgi:four helix bundle protein
VDSEKWVVVSGKKEEAMTVRSYKDLIAWQKAMDLVSLVYRATQRFPQHELFALSNQLRRGAVSIPSNIAEGQGRGTTKDFLQFLSIARGSLQEVETQLLIAARLGYLDEQTLSPLTEATTELGRIISGLRSGLSHPER